VTQQSCVLAPRSKKGYSPFHLGRVFTAEGDTLPVGKIVMDTRHADISLGYTAAAIHYDHTGDEVAVVRAGEDEFGIWVAGALVPEATPAKAAKLRRSPLSGDWRRVEGNLELTAALAVNVPAFPVYSMMGEDQTALVAAGQVFPHDGFVHVEREEFPTNKEVEFDAMSDEEAQEERAWDLRILLEEDNEFDQWKRARAFAELFQMDGETPPEVPAEDPVYGMAAMAARQMDAQYQVIEEPEGAAEPEEGGEESGGTGSPSTGVPVGAAPQPGA